MPEFKIRDLRRDYHHIVRAVRLSGEAVPSRDGDTREILDATIIIEDPTDCLPVGIGRKLNPRIAALEALQLIAGVSTPDLLVRASPTFKRFQDGEVYHGAYGPRLAPQLPAVVRRLQADPGTRQAVMSIWDPLHDLHVDSRKDYPCTLILQFLIRNGKLQLHTKMRSNDVWLGLTYDAFQFSQMQLTVARVLGLDAGPYFHHTTSLHIYERDVDASRTLEPTKALAPAGRPLGIPVHGIELAIDEAKRLLRGEAPTSFANVDWYRETLKRLFDDQNHITL